MDISDDAPSKYFPTLVAGKSEDNIKKLESEHALLYKWEEMAYEDFLIAIRKNMAEIIKKGYQTICDADKRNAEKN